jgi:hypothetical protein
VAHTGENRNAYRVLIGKTEGNRHLEDLGIKRRILKGTLKKQHRVPWTGFILHWTGTNNRLLQTQYQPSSSIKCSEFPDLLIKTSSFSRRFLHGVSE